MKKGIVFSHEESTNELKVSKYDDDSLALILNVPLFNYDTSEFTKEAVSLAKELGFELTVPLIYTGSPMDAVQDVWLDNKLEGYAESSDIDLDELLNAETVKDVDYRKEGDNHIFTPVFSEIVLDPRIENEVITIDEELKAKLRKLAPELSDSEFEALFISQKVVNDVIKKNTEEPRIEDVTFIKDKQLQPDTIDKRFSPKKRLKQFIYPSLD